MANSEDAILRGVWYTLVAMIAQLIFLLIAFLLSAAVSALAAWRGSLTRSGAVVASFVGTLTIGLGGWQWGLLLGLFFVSSSLLSHFKQTEKRKAAQKFAKGHRRDWAQVMANGGPGAVLATFSAVWPHAYWYIFFVGVMATVTADTWATELGTLSNKPPRMITTGRMAEVGTSGAVSLLGTMVSLLGGLVVGIVAGVITEFPLVMTTLVGALSGLAGSLVDSLMGATVQGLYFSVAKGTNTEKALEEDGTPNRLVRGWAWMTNDLVNLTASVLGGFCATALAALWFLRQLS